MSRVNIKSLQLNSAPGLPKGLEEFQFQPGLNIIFGPNASGKTTSAAAMKTLLWQQKFKPGSRFSLYGGFQANGREYVINWDRSYCEIQADGRRIDTPDLPIPENWQMYDLSITDLLTSTDKGFAEAVWREVMGGLDLNSAAEQLGATQSLPGKGNVYHKFIKARGHLSDVRRRQEQLLDQKNNRHKLEKQRDSAFSDQKKAELVASLIEIRKLEEERGEKRIKLEQLPKVLGELYGDEADRMEEMEGQLDSLRSDESGKKSDLEQYRDKITELGLPEEGLPGHKPGYWENRIEQITAKEQEIERVDTEIRNCKSDLETLSGRNRWEFSSDEITLNTEKINELAEWTQRWYGHQEARKRVEAEYNRIKDIQEPDEAAEVLDSGITSLANWLKEARYPEGVLINPVLGWPALGFALLAGLLAWVSVLASSLSAAIAAVLLLIGLLRGSKRAASDLEFYQKSYRKTGLEEPEKWEVDSVFRLMDWLISRKTEVQFRQDQVKRREQLENEMQQLDGDREKLLKDRDNMLQDIGIAPSQSEAVTLQHMAEVLHQIKDSEVRLQAGQQKKRTLQEEKRKLEDELIEDIRDYVSVELKSHAELPQFISELIERNRNFNQLKKDISEAEKTLEKIREQQNEVLKKIEVLRDKTGCDNYNELKSLLKNFQLYQEITKSMEALESKITILKDKISDDEQFDPEWEQMDHAALVSLKDEFNERGDKAEELRERLSKINYEIEQAERNHDLEAALSEYERARSELSEIRSDALRKQTRKLVMDFLTEEHRQENSPEVLMEANRLFTAFTRGHFELTMDHGGRQFRAKNSSLGLVHDLNELSSGTRIQLLLAVRLAFIQRQERGVKLPLFADELLAVSDRLRADAIIDSLQQTVRDGRQLFYFTAQEEEVQRWLRASEESSDMTEPAIHYLADHKPRISAAWPEEPPDVRIQRDIPEPGTDSYEQYIKRLELSGFDPLVQPASELPVWMMLNDPGQLYECLRRGLDTRGRLESWIKGGNPLPGMQEPDKQRFIDTGKILDFSLKLYHRGRAFPVGFAELKEAGLVSEHQAEGIYKLISEVNGDPVALIDQVQSVNGVGKKRKTEIEEFLSEKGYLPEQDKIDDTQFNLEVLKLVERTEGVESEYVQQILERLFGRQN